MLQGVSMRLQSFLAPSGTTKYRGEFGSILGAHDQQQF